MDIVDSVTRSRMMAGIKGKNTKPEMKLRSLLHAAGYRFRLHRKDLPGSPDIVLPMYKAVIFVHGCFWHRHHGCKYCTMPASNELFWENKLRANEDRDAANQAALNSEGWRVYIVWECAVRSMDVLPMVLGWLHGCSTLDETPLIYTVQNRSC